MKNTVIKSTLLNLVIIFSIFSSYSLINTLNAAPYSKTEEETVKLTAKQARINRLYDDDELALLFDVFADHIPNMMRTYNELESLFTGLEGYVEEYRRGPGSVIRRVLTSPNSSAMSVITFHKSHDKRKPLGESKMCVGSFRSALEESGITKEDVDVVAKKRNIGNFESA